MLPNPGMCVSPGGCSMVALLQFANDSLLFIKAKEEMVVHLRCLLRMFETISGLKVGVGMGWAMVGPGLAL